MHQRLEVKREQRSAIEENWDLTNRMGVCLRNYRTMHARCYTTHDYTVQQRACRICAKHIANTQKRRADI